MRFLMVLISALWLSGCASLVNVDYDKATNFSQLKKFKIETKPVRIAKDTRIDSPFMQQRVVAAIEQAMKSKGLELTSDNPELGVKYYLDIKQEIETQDSGMAIGFGTTSGRTAIGFGFAVPASEAASYDKLVVTLDMIALKTGKLIWRGSLGYRLLDGSTPEKSTKLIQEMVQEILKQYPPK